MSKLILLVEDSEDDTRILIDSLRKSGVVNPIHSVFDGRQAIAYLNGDGEFADREKYPAASVLILDLRMPQLNGFQVLEWIQPKAAMHRLLIVVLSALTGAADISRAYQLGAHTFLTKPCQVEDITNLIKSFPDHWMVAPPHGEPPTGAQPRENGSKA